MRVDLLWLESFKNLRDFEVDFDLNSTRQVVVGRNGVGKSNLFEALALIFRDLDLEAKADEDNPGFGYRIEYHCNEHFVRITSSLQQGKAYYSRKYEIAPDGGDSTLPAEEREYGEVTQTAFYKRNRPIVEDGQQRPNPDRLLPLYVFGYYSGESGRFDHIFDRHEELYYKQQITGEEAPLRPLFLAKPQHSQFALLAFFAANDAKAKEFLRSEFRIDGLDSVLFTLHEPYYYKAKSPSSPEIDQRFWQVAGKVAPLLDSLFDNAFAPLHGKQRERITLGQTKEKEKRFLFLPSEDAVRRVAEGLEPKEFFARLESGIFSDVISKTGEDVRILVKLTDAAEPVPFNELSEGEQQLLTIIGLMRFTAENESLFLLDEPDTHLNPAWCLDLLANLRKYGVEPLNSQILVTTHSPLTFAGLEKQEVVIIERETDDRIISFHPTSNPKGMGFSAILTSELFGLRAALDPETLTKLDAKRELALKEPKTDEDRIELARLNEELGKLDFSKSARDPLYLEYIRAITEAQEEQPLLKESAPEKDKWRLRQHIAQDLAKKLLEKGVSE